jgi:hypothetical protein
MTHFLLICLSTTSSLPIHLGRRGRKEEKGERRRRKRKMKKWRRKKQEKVENDFFSSLPLFWYLCYSVGSFQIYISWQLEGKREKKLIIYHVEYLVSMLEMKEGEKGRNQTTIGASQVQIHQMRKYPLSQTVNNSIIILQICSFASFL